MIYQKPSQFSGFVTYACSECPALWDVKINESKSRIRHSRKECLEEKNAFEELEILRAKNPGRSFARSALTGRWIPV